MFCRIQPFCLALMLCLVTIQSAPAETIPDLFNTGVNSSGIPLGLGVQDPHYVNLANGVAPFTYGDRAWTSNANSNWLSPSASGGDGSTYTVTYRTTFTLPTNALLTSVKIVGSWAMDDKGLDILVNGSSTGISQVTDTFTSFHSFTLPNTFYKVGQNTLDFKWMNGVAVGGVNVVFTQATYTVATATVSGRLKMEGLVAYADDQNITFTARPVNGGSAITQVVTIPASGNFSLTGLAFAPYILHIKGTKYLAANVSVDVTGGNVSGVKANLRAGDADNSNKVDIGDFGILVGAYGSNSSDPTSGYDTRADLNDDGTVDLADFSLLITNYGTKGDQ